MKVELVFILILSAFSLNFKYNNLGSNEYLSKKRLFTINKNLYPSQSSDYFFKGDFIEETDEKKMIRSNNFVISPEKPLDCFLDKQKLISNINSLREKHTSLPLKWDVHLAGTAQILSERSQKEKQCSIDSSIIQNEFGKIAFSFPSDNPLSEVDVLHKWYSMIYGYDFKNQHFIREGSNYYPLTYLLFDSTQRIGCAKSCCTDNSIYVCVFDPVIINPSEKDIALHIKPNKYIH